MLHHVILYLIIIFISWTSINTKVNIKIVFRPPLVRHVGFSSGLRKRKVAEWALEGYRPIFAGEHRVNRGRVDIGGVSPLNTLQLFT